MSRPGSPISSVTHDRAGAERPGRPGPQSVHQPGSVQRSAPRPQPDPTDQSGQVPPPAEATARDGFASSRPADGASTSGRATEFGNPGGNWLG